MDSSRHPEQDVVDEIDRLVTETMKAGIKHDWYETTDDCPVCGSDWHGLTGDGVGAGKRGCPGEFGTDDEKRLWVKDYNARLEAARQASQFTLGKKLPMPASGALQRLSDLSPSPTVPGFTSGDVVRVSLFLPGDERC